MYINCGYEDTKKVVCHNCKMQGAEDDTTLRGCIKMVILTQPLKDYEAKFLLCA